MLRQRNCIFLLRYYGCRNTGELLNFVPINTRMEPKRDSCISGAAAVRQNLAEVVSEHAVFCALQQLRFGARLAVGWLQSRQLDIDSYFLHEERLTNNHNVMQILKLSRYRRIQTLGNLAFA